MDPRAKQYDDIAGKLIQGADNAKAAGDLSLTSVIAPLP